RYRIFAVFGILLVAVGLMVAGFLALPSPSVSAAPHTISAFQHPFDPDWLEVHRILLVKCASCHRAGTERSDLTNYQGLFLVHPDLAEALVTPGKPDKSPLWNYVAWNHDGRKGSSLAEMPDMPPDPEEWLTAGQLETLQRWIKNGALEYRLPKTCSPRPLMEIDFPSARECKMCHPKQFTEWSRSMHAYAQHSPAMEAFTRKMLERTNGTIGTFCTRCHTPIGTALGEEGDRPNVYRLQISMEGVTCVVCHRLKDPYYKSNGRRFFQPGKLIEGCMYGPFDDSVSAEANAHAARGSHHLKQAAMCGTCHDVTNPAGMRLEEAFSEWQNSPAAKNGITCQHCHMGPIPGVPVLENQRPLGRAAVVPGVKPENIPLRHLSDHSFAGPDYSLLPDTEFPYKLDWMYETDYRNTAQLTAYQRKMLDRLRRKNRKELAISREQRYALLSNAAELALSAPNTAKVGDRIKVHVDVISKLAGHSFPTGFSEERQAWVELTVYDPRGCVVFASGDLDHNQDLRDEHSHDVAEGKMPFDRYLLNFQNKFVVRTFRGTERSVVIPVNRHLQPLSLLRPADEIAASFGRPSTLRVAKASLPPLGTIGRDYPVSLPNIPGDYRVVAKLNFRHLPPILFDKLGVGHLKHLLEIVTIDCKTQVIRVTNSSR
ncbi:MAG: hypothetical protein KDA84_05785, partial [Planctomycetaceae bacterium]|nr:hypothetical protein [Planctomycetaceae bacterium]